MTRITETKLNRLIEVGEIKETINGFRPIVFQKAIKRNPPTPAESRLEVPCRWCKKPMFIARGQVANYHKLCRKNRNKE